MQNETTIVTALLFAIALIASGQLACNLWR